MGRNIPKKSLSPRLCGGDRRYAQVLKRDWKRFLPVNMLTLATLTPFAAGVFLATATASLAVLIPACISGGIIAGPGIACMVDCVLRSLRDNRDSWWYNYKKAWKQNFRAAMLPGILVCLLIGFLVFAWATVRWSELPASVVTMVLLAVSALLVTMIFSIWWPQVVLFNQRPGIQLNNSVRFILQNFPISLAAGMVRLIWWTAVVLLLPWSALLLPLAGMWFVQYTSTFLLYGKLDETFRIEAQIAANFPDQLPEYDSGEG